MHIRIVFVVGFDPVQGGLVAIARMLNPPTHVTSAPGQSLRFR